MQRFIAGKPVRSAVHVPDKLVNLVDMTRHAASRGTSPRAAGLMAARLMVPGLVVAGLMLASLRWPA